MTSPASKLPLAWHNLCMCKIALVAAAAYRFGWKSLHWFRQQFALHPSWRGAYACAWAPAITLMIHWVRKWTSCSGGGGGKRARASNRLSTLPYLFKMLLGACLAASRTASALARCYRGTARRPAGRRAAAAPHMTFSVDTSLSGSEQAAPLASEGHRCPPAAADGEQPESASLTINDLPDDLLGQIFVTAFDREQNW